VMGAGTSARSALAGLLRLRQRPAPDQVLLPTERRFQVGERELVVRPLVIGEIARISTDLGEIIEQVIREHPEIDLAKLDEHLPVILPLVLGALERLLERLFGIERQYLAEHLTIAQAVEIVTALLEVNQLPEIRGNVSRALQLMKTAAVV
jgi:hypothetical protein